MLSKLSIWAAAFINAALNKRQWVRALPLTLCALVAAILTTTANADNERSNHFNDPFVTITKGIANCPAAASFTSSARASTEP